MLTGQTFYGPETGQSHITLAWWREIRQKLGRVVMAEMTDYRESNYPLMLRDDRGNRVYMMGVTSGYFGTGSRATATVLQESGFTADWVWALPLERPEFRLSRAEYLRKEAGRLGLRVVAV